MNLLLDAKAIMRNPWAWDEKTLEWARKECELKHINYCPHGYGECESGCCYPGRCGKFTDRRAP